MSWFISAALFGDVGVAERKGVCVCVWTEPDVCSKAELTFTPVTCHCGDACAPVWQ